MFVRPVLSLRCCQHAGATPAATNPVRSQHTVLCRRLPPPDCVGLVFVLFLFCATMDILTPADGTGQFTINNQPLSTPCATLDEAVAHLAGGPGGSQRHPDIRVRPAGAPLRVEAHLGAAGASTQPGGDEGDTNAVLASFASYDDATVV